jgi:PAS domain S-box-containing protein
MELSLSPVTSDTVAGRFLLALIRDISDRRRTQQASRHAGETYREIVENAADGIYQSSRDGRFLTVNPALARILGYDSPRALRESVTDIATQLYVVPGRQDEFIHQVERHDRLPASSRSSTARTAASSGSAGGPRRRDRRGRVRWYEDGSGHHARRQARKARRPSDRGGRSRIASPSSEASAAPHRWTTRTHSGRWRDWPFPFR